MYVCELMSHTSVAKMFCSSTDQYIAGWLATLLVEDKRMGTRKAAPKVSGPPAPTSAKSPASLWTRMQHSLAASMPGASLLSAFNRREKISAGAHGYFEVYDALTRYTRAAPFSTSGKITPVFARFSTSAIARDRAGPVRDTRDFAVKFYTEEGDWDLVGTNMPVFFIQDARSLPYPEHPVKAEPHPGMLQAAAATNAFWDLVSMMPESTHMLMWIMSDRAIPRSLRMMQGFGVHTFRLVNASGESVFCKFHWKPLFGTHSLTWEEAVSISITDPDFHRRDLWEAIDAGDYPEWELGLQIFTAAQSERFSFDVLDGTKLVPEELIPVLPVGRMVLDRNPDNASVTDQVEFCAAHAIPGVNFGNDPLPASPDHPRIDPRIPGPGSDNLRAIAADSPLAAMQNPQRDDSHLQALQRKRVTHETPVFESGCRLKALANAGLPGQQDGMCRGKHGKFSEHYAQATLFFDSQTNTEKAHLIEAFRFALGKVTVPAIRRRMLASLVNVSPTLAAGTAAGLGIPVPAPLPRALPAPMAPEVHISMALSLLALPGKCGIRTRQIAMLVADGVHGPSIRTIHTALVSTGAVVHFVGPRIGPFTTDDGAEMEADRSMEHSPSVQFDALVLPDGSDAFEILAADAHTMEYVKDQYRHCKSILAIGASRSLLGMAGIEPSPGKDPGILVTDREKAADAATAFIAAIAAHRHHCRDSAPLPV